MNPWRRLVAFVEEREDALSLALCRIALGATILAHVGRFFVSGAAKLALVHQRFGGLGSSDGWLSMVGGSTWAHVQALGLVTLLAAALMTLGLFTRPAILVTWLSYRALSGLNIDARGAYDAVIINTLFVLLLAGSGRALSFDQRRRPGPRDVARWPRLLLVFHLGLMYAGSAITKISSGWIPGGDASALWYILHQPMWARGALDDLPGWFLPLTQVSTTLVWCWEALGLVFVLAVFLRETDAPSAAFARMGKRILDRIRFREIYLVLGVVMHVGIELTMEVGAFSFASLALYVCALRPAEWAARARR